MTLARKRRIHAARGGHCPCGVEVPLSGPGVTYDHTVQLAFDGAEEDENIWPICDDCRRKKDAADAKARGKVRRLRKKAARAAQAHEAPDIPGDPVKGPGEGKTGHGRAIPSRPFPKVQRKLQSRPFPRRKT